MSTVFAILLFFLAISSFWMFKVGSKKFTRGIILATIGIAAAILIVLI